MKPGFKRWFLNESPDKLDINGKNVRWSSGVTFFLFNNYALYTKGTPAPPALPRTHEGLLRDLYDILTNKYPATRISLDKLDEIIKSDEGLLFHGQINQTALKEIMSVLQMVGTYGDWGGYRNNHNEIEGAPNILLGRVWPELKAISFWNRSQYVFPKSNQILDFIKVFGNPTEYQYDINIGHNDFSHEVINYEDFVKRKAA
jgi:hypothetical protein